MDVNPEDIVTAKRVGTALEKNYRYPEIKVYIC